MFTTILLLMISYTIDRLELRREWKYVVLSLAVHSRSNLSTLLQLQVLFVGMPYNIHTILHLHKHSLLLSVSEMALLFNYTNI